MPNQYSDDLNGLLKTSDRMIDASEHRYIKELADADTIDVWIVKDILDRCVCFALCAGIVITFFEMIMFDEAARQKIPVPRETRLNLLGDAPDKRDPYDKEDLRLMSEREQKAKDDAEDKTTHAT